VEVLLVGGFDFDNQIVQQKSPPPASRLQKSGCTPDSTLAPAASPGTLPPLFPGRFNFPQAVVH